MDYSKLRGRIREIYKTEGNFADALGVNKGTISLKLNNQSGFSQKEILIICQLLKIDDKDIPIYFFNNGGSIC